MQNTTNNTCCCSNKSTAEEYNQQLHVAIIGSGSAAFASAIKAAEGGARVTLIESEEVIGGCCVNLGCVPSKILIRAAQLSHQQRANPFVGIENHQPKIKRDLIALQQHARVKELRTAKYQNILENNPNLTLIKGFARFKSDNILSIESANGKLIELEADRILIATGSSAVIPRIDGLSETPYWTSTEALFCEQTPEHLVVIGSSVIALEIAQAFRRLGSEVTIIARHSLLYKEDPILGEQLQICLEKEGIRVSTNTQASKIEYDGSNFIVNTNTADFSSDRLLISTGRQANTANLNLNCVGIETDDNGAILVNNKMETSVENIYAAGDCSNMPQFVYVAAAAGSRAGINMTGGSAELDLNTMPAVIFTAPQVATVGLSEKQALEQGIPILTRVLDMENVPRALANFETEGFIKIVAEEDSGTIVGVQILAHEAGEIIQSAALAIHNKMTVEELANQLFPYLTMVEGLKLCAQTFNKDVKELSCCAG